MFCDPTALRRSPLAVGALLASILLLATACGHKKSPTPPPSKVPQRVALKAHQRGHEAVLSFPFPTTTISGTPLPGISKIEIRQLAVEVPEFAIELLAEEARQRKEAQELLDELGLPLYEVPAVDPLADPAAAGSDATAEGEAAEQPTTGETAAGDDPMREKTDLPPTELPTEPPTELPTEQETSEDLVDPAVAEDLRDPTPTSDPPIEEESVGADDEASGEEDSDGEQADAVAESGADDEADRADEADGEAVAGEEVELSEEEQQAIAVETARNLLQSPPTPKSSFITATTKDFKDGAELVASIEGGEVTQALIGDKVVFRLPLPPRPTEGPELGYLYSATVYALNGKPSDPSDRIAILPTETPPAPQEVELEARADGVHLSWSAEEDPAGGFRVYRRDAQTRLYGDPVALLTLGSERFHLDRQAVFGARYIYGVTAVESASPLLESDISSEHEIDYQDRFGPATPSGLVAFPEAGRVRLLWTPGPDLDVAGYEVSRRAEDDEQATPLTDELVTRGQYLDETVSSGEVWFYSVVAVDSSGNRSETSAETQVRVP